MCIRDRFGVTHKEKIKQLKKDVDVLTLTATLIPRTLHMSLKMCIRDSREGAPEYTGRLCVIGSKLKEDKLAELFGLA